MFYSPPSSQKPIATLIVLVLEEWKLADHYHDPNDVWFSVVLNGNSFALENFGQNLPLFPNVVSSEQIYS